ncbi:hypothetical protein CAPN001_24590 [Capnocytophaga stomatis]|uniref:hypothetical protein n=1 Tax=Capnocytophaga stomatis TaxID=1848904 RepID=UPI00194E74B9|nr:hypothetical protein [Capnocytophaga stomatis]GIJ97890.1 hypothetical protein CAPN001_24590 [Capnocytophaga stomatis]
MKKYILIIVTLFLVGCSTNKQVQFTQGENKNVELFFVNYGYVQKMSIYLRRQIKLKNLNIRFATMKINYFHDREQVNEVYARSMSYGKDGNLYIIGSGKGEELHQINVYPLSEREIIFERRFYIDYFKFEGIYKNLEQYLSLAIHPLEKHEVTGEMVENEIVCIYEEPFSEFKRKNPELLEFLTKGDSIELEVVSPIKQKYKFKAEW